IMCASPISRPSACSGWMRASMHVSTARCWAGGIALSPWRNLFTNSLLRSMKRWITPMRNLQTRVPPKPYRLGRVLVQVPGPVSASGGRCGATRVGRRRLAWAAPGAEDGDHRHAEPVHRGGDEHDAVDDRNQACDRKDRPADDVRK